MANGLQGAGNALLAVTAGLQGRGPQFQAQQQAQQARQQEAELERRKTVFTDSASALNFAKQGRWDLVQQLGQNRLQLSQQFPGADFSDTQQLVQLAGLAAGGNIEAQERLTKTLENNVQIGKGLGILQDPQAEEFTLSPGQTRFRGGEVIARGGEKTVSGRDVLTQVQSSKILPDGSTVQVFKDGSTRVTGPGGKVLQGQERIDAVAVAQEFGIDVQSRRAGGRAGATATERRVDTLITRGIAAAESTATVRRALDLLDRVKTGGPQAISLALRQRLGIEGADEGELSNSLGKAVLSQLRETFGAAFTQEEGDRLIRLEAAFGKSPETNRRLLKQALRIAERTARRAQKAALKRGNQAEAADIEDLLTFTLDVGGQETAAAPAQEAIGATQEGATATNPQTGAKLQFIGGQWVPI